MTKLACVKNGKPGYDFRASGKTAKTWCDQQKCLTLKVGNVVLKIRPGIVLGFLVDVFKVLKAL